MLVSGVQQSESVVHIHVTIRFQILSPVSLLQNMEQSSLCYTVVLVAYPFEAIICKADVYKSMTE